MKKQILSSRMPTYLGVYNSLYSDIVNGVYIANDFLPSESALAEKYSVSRNTLRQALAILNEDGLILKSQGKGTVVQPVDRRKHTEHLVNPLVECCKVNVDEVCTDYNFGTPTDIAIERLQLSKSDVVLAGTTVYRQHGKTLGYSFIQIPASLLAQLEIDIAQEESIQKLLNTTIFQIAKEVAITIKVVEANEIESMYLEIPEETILLHMEAMLFDEKNQPIARCKFYFKPEYYTLKYIL